MEAAPEELHEIMQRPGPRAFKLVDARDADAFVYSRLLWAELIPLERIATDAPKRLPLKSEPVVVYCRDGSVSERACEMLSEMGYEYVFHLAGGLEAWKREVEPDFPLADSAADPAPAGPPPVASTNSPMPAPAPPPATASDDEISPGELRTLMNHPGPRDFRLIDVREEDEFRICRLEWAELIPLSQLPEQAPRRLVDKDRTIVVYCHHGMRSQHACEWLRRAGYQNVFNLTGGIDAWAQQVEPGMRRY